jgi:hypothetical protein
MSFTSVRFVWHARVGVQQDERPYAVLFEGRQAAAHAGGVAQLGRVVELEAPHAYLDASRTDAGLGQHRGHGLGFAGADVEVDAQAVEVLRRRPGVHVGPPRGEVERAAPEGHLGLERVGVGAGKLRGGGHGVPRADGLQRLKRGRRRLDLRLGGGKRQCEQQQNQQQNQQGGLSRKECARRVS